MGGRQTSNLGKYFLSTYDVPGTVPHKARETRRKNVALALKRTAGTI